MNHTASLCFGLLAGGQSRRMGVDKAALVWRGQPLWQHQLRLAHEIGANEILISGRPEGPYRGAGQVVKDALPGRGPLGGIASLLAAMQSSWLVVVAVDMPLIEAGDLRELLAARSRRRGVVPWLNDRAEPLAAIYPRSLAETARQFAEAADHSVQSFIRAAEAAGLIRRLPWQLNRAGCLRSFNTPAEWAAAAQSVEAKPAALQPD